MKEDERIYNEKLGARIALARGGKSQVVFAGEIGVNKNTLLGYEKGRVAPDITTIRKICTLSGVNWDWMVSETGPMRPSEGSREAVVKEDAAGSTGNSSGQDAFDALGMAEGMGLLAKIYSAGDNIYIRAINANLMAFADAVETKAKALLMTETIQQMQIQLIQMQEQINKLQTEVLSLRNQNNELKRELRTKGCNNEPGVSTG